MTEVLQNVLISLIVSYFLHKLLTIVDTQNLVRNRLSLNNSRLTVRISFSFLKLERFDRGSISGRRRRGCDVTPFMMFETYTSDAQATSEVF